MKVLIFSTAYFPHVGGAEVAVKEITDRIDDIKFDMITVKLDRKDKQHEKVGRINVYRLGWGLGKIDKLLFPFQAARLTKKLHKKNKYNAVWSIMASFSGFGALFFKKKNLEVKFLLTLQEGDDLNEVEERVNFPIIKKWFLEIFQKADYIQSISNYLADWARSKKVSCPVEVVPNGVDIEKFQTEFSDEELNKFKKELNIEEGEKILITTSRLVKKNAVNDIIEAMVYLPKNIKLLILGTGSDLEKLRNLTRERGVEKRVLFLGYIDNKKIPKYLKISDIFIRLPLSEGLGNSFIEAMATGVFILATEVGGIKDLLLKPGSILTLDVFRSVSEYREIAKRIEYILDDKNNEKVKKIIENAKQMVKEKYDWNIIAKQIREIFLKLNPR
ncbi:hypothetical protein COV49_04355 [Candidatus Falkowbacteria bacterium CG11_big_fil_rev_8_21_14_0_20_39_10]|uniref:Glycosyl transferase family 1 domain-containing protein n=1 Tax=Candidatus Falkowbacteria bacterium CG11_big_fil_rev_8_21_14_0_20_39_10 TaxID=1974570 RepID=A0A2M6K846_9BACT|nr:MAG: hypothetical protein COV49_04355 [Candidatus Falkowbacteria bacterium CG11_big_fil_rev_8_21_14_0_20_39_10]